MSNRPSAHHRPRRRHRPTRAQLAAVARLSSLQRGCTCEPDVELGHIGQIYTQRIKHEPWCPAIQGARQ